MAEEMAEETMAGGTDPVRTLCRRDFIKGVIAAGAAVSSVSYLFRVSGALVGQPRAGSSERLVTLNVNGQARRVDVMQQETLAMTLRYKLGLTGTKLGCDRAECGTCTVLIDDVPHYACSVLTRTVRDRKVVTIEGLASPSGTLHPVQQAVVDECAFCMPGFVMAAVGFLNWNGRKARSGQRRGSKVRGIGVTVGPHGAGSIGYDGLMTLRPDGKLYVQSGAGNLGTHSVIDLARVAAEVLAMPWEKVEVVWGDTSKNLPWTCMSVGSQTTHAMTRANHAGATDARRKLQEIAARDLGGAPEDYQLGNERVYRRGNPARGMSYTQAAKRALQLGGKYDGHELPADIHPVTKASAEALAGLGLMGVAKDNYPLDGDTYSFVIGFAEVEVDVETGKVWLVDYLGVGDVGTVINPRSLGGQINGGSCLGIAHALCQKTVYDRQYGLPLATRFHYNKPLTILDIPPKLQWAALDIPDPETPVGARGVGEPPVGAGFGAVMNAIADAVGEDVFRPAPVTADIVLMSLEHGRRMHEPLRAHI